MKFVTVDIETSDFSLDPGGAAVIRKYKIIVASPDSASAANPKEMYIDLTLLHPCRFAVFSDQTFNMMEVYVGGPATT